MTDHAAAANAVRGVMGVPERAPLTATPSLPLASSKRFTHDETQLYDLTYHAATRYLVALSGMTTERAHFHAGRIASSALVLALASDQCHDETPPQAETPPQEAEPC